LKRQGKDTMPGRLTDKPNQHPPKGPVNKVTGGGALVFTEIKNRGVTDGTVQGTVQVTWFADWFVGVEGEHDSCLLTRWCLYRSR
jgi:hypothetical protein